MRTRFENLRPAIAGAALCALLAGCSEKPATPAAPASGAPVLSAPIHRAGAWVVEARDATSKTHRVLLDTGASFNLFEPQGALAAAPMTREADAAFLRQGVLTSSSFDAAITVNTLSDAHEISAGLGPALRIQDWSIPAGTIAFRGKMGRFASMGDAPFEGVIGAHSMSKLTWRADYVAGNLSVYANAAPTHEWQQCTFMTLDAGSRLPIVELGLDSESNHFVVDTGYDGDIMLPQEIFDRLQKAHAFPHVHTIFATDLTDRIVPHKEGLITGFTLGQKSLPRLAVSSGGQDLRLGMGALAKMDRFELDFRNNRFCFDLPARPQDSELTVADSALERQGDAYVIAALVPDGRLAASGAKTGDLITMIDQTPVKTLDLSHLSERLRDPSTGKVTLQRGNRTLVLTLKS